MRDWPDPAGMTLPAPILPDWRITCFFVAQSHRRRGVATLALQGALTQIAALGVGLVEGYPDDTASQKTSASFLWGGTVAAFEAQRFTRLRPSGKTQSGQRACHP